MMGSVRTLISYNTIELFDITNPDTLEQAEKLAMQFANKVGNEPMELVGPTKPYLLARTFKEIRKYATEVVYRQKGQDTAVRLYSMLPPKEYRLPYFVIDHQVFIPETETNNKSNNQDITLEVEELLEQVDYDLEKLQNRCRRLTQEVKEVDVTTKEASKAFMVTLEVVLAYADAVSVNGNLIS